MPFGLGLTFKRLGEFITTVCSVQVLWSDELFMTKILFILFYIGQEETSQLNEGSQPHLNISLTSGSDCELCIYIYEYIHMYIYCCQIVFSNWCRSGGNLIRKLRLLVAPSELRFAVESKTQLPGKILPLKGTVQQDFKPILFINRTHLGP